MSITGLDASNLAVLIAAFRVANAPVSSNGPSRAADAATGHAAGPNGPGRGAAPGPRISTETAPPSMRPAGPAPGPLGPAARPPEPATLVTISSAARASPAATLAAPLAAVIAEARRALAEIRRDADGGAQLDRRALYAVAFEAGDLFSPPEREAARWALLWRALAILAGLDAPSSNGVEASVLRALARHFDAAGPEERLSVEWIVQRAAVARALDRLGALPTIQAPASDPMVEVVRLAFEAFSRGGAPIDGPLPTANLRDMPLLGTAFLSPEMLLVGLSAIARENERLAPPALRRDARRKARSDDDDGFLIRPLGADWDGVPDPAPAIAAWEAATGESLPADYRAFLLAFNGGRVYPNMFAYTVPLTDASSTGAMTFLDRLHDWARVAAAFDGEVFGDRLPPGFLAIGCDPGGMEILLSLRASDHGAVFCWPHAREPWGEARNARVYRLAASFDEFIDALTDAPGQPGRRYWDRPALRRLVKMLDY